LADLRERPPLRHPYFDHPGVLAFAHRGGAGEAPENSLRAFEAAVALGYRYLETDVHATADGVLLAFHDGVLDRVTDRTGTVAEMPYAEVRKARIAGTEPIPRLDELLEAFPRARFNIDPKADHSVGPLIKVLRDARALERVCVTSFSDRRTARLREALGPELCTGLGPKGVARLRASAWVGLEGRLSPFPEGCAQVPHRQYGLKLVDARFVAAAHRLGLQVHVWTVDEEAEMAELLDMGVDGLMTDRPAVLKRVLEARKLWVEA